MDLEVRILLLRLSLVMMNCEDFLSLLLMKFCFLVLVFRMMFLHVLMVGFFETEWINFLLLLLLPL